MTKPIVLLVNPPIYDFTAYDFWLRPYGMLRMAGRLRHACEYRSFDFLWPRPRDGWGRGRCLEAMAPKPEEYRDIPRRFRRFGRPRWEFREFLRGERFDVALIQSMMTYWYPGIREVIADLRELQPHARIVLGGVYATLCSGHARGLGADLVVAGADVQPLCRLPEIGDAHLSPPLPPTIALTRRLGNYTTIG
jgi:hypothetical protein